MLILQNITKIIELSDRIKLDHLEKNAFGGIEGDHHKIKRLESLIV